MPPETLAILAGLVVGMTVLWAALAGIVVAVYMVDRKERRETRAYVASVGQQCADLAAVVASHAGDPATAAAATAVGKRILGSSPTVVREPKKPAIIESADPPEFNEMWAVQVVNEGYRDEFGNPLDDENKALAKATYEALERSGRLPERSAA